MRSTLAWLGVAVLVASSASAVDVFVDDFSGSGGPLNGTTPDVTTARGQLVD